MKYQAIAIVVIAIVGVLFFSGCTEYFPQQQQPVQPYIPYTPAEETYHSGTFTVTPTAYHNSGFTIATDATVFKLPFALNQTHYVRESDNTTWNHPYMNFSITPQAWEGAKSTDLVTIYYEYTEMDGLVASDSGTYYFLTLTDGYRQAKFTQKANTANYGYGSGSITTTLTSPVVLYLNLTVTNASLCQTNAVIFQNALESVPQITFHNSDYTWTKTYTIDIFPSRVWESG